MLLELRRAEDTDDDGVAGDLNSGLGRARERVLVPVALTTRAIIAA
jgi:hypothetical protein